MDEPIIERREGYVFARYGGEYSLQGLFSQSVMLFERVQRDGDRLMLVDLTELTGHLSIAARYLVASRLYKYWRPGFRVAAIVLPGQLVPDLFGQVVLKNLNMGVKAFTDPGEALAWLLADAGE